MKRPMHVKGASEPALVGTPAPPWSGGEMGQMTNMTNLLPVAVDAKLQRARRDFIGWGRENDNLTATACFVVVHRGL